MGDINHLKDQEAISKMKQLVDDIGICMFCTQVNGGPFETRPMATQDVDDEGNIWFLSHAESHKNFEIRQNDRVQLLYSKPSDSHFLSVYGQADILKDRQKIDEVWNKLAKAWFTEGKNDPDLTLIRIRPEQAYYWDTKHGKMISLLKIVAAAITSTTMDDGIEGSLELNKHESTTPTT